MVGADVFIGVSGGTVPEEVVATMAPDAIIFGLANPSPEVHPEVAHRHARVVATGRSDFPNQINNVLAFPGIFRGAFDARATAITEGMKLAAADALAAIVADEAARGPDHPLARSTPASARPWPRPSPRPPGATGSLGGRARFHRVPGEPDFPALQRGNGRFARAVGRLSATCRAARVEACSLCTPKASPPTTR